MSVPDHVRRHYRPFLYTFREDSSEITGRWYPSKYIGFVVANTLREAVEKIVEELYDNKSKNVSENLILNSCASAEDMKEYFFRSNIRAVPVKKFY